MSGDVRIRSAVGTERIRDASVFYGGPGRDVTPCHQRVEEGSVFEALSMAGVAEYRECPRLDAPPTPSGCCSRSSG